MVAIVTIGFVKDAVHHIDVSGFNVYHKNRLIKVEFAMINKGWWTSSSILGFIPSSLVFKVSVV